MGCCTRTLGLLLEGLDVRCTMEGGFGGEVLWGWMDGWGGGVGGCCGIDGWVDGWVG